MRPYLALFCALVLSGCAGKPTTYLTLSPTAPAQQRAAMGTVAISSIIIPPAIDRAQFTTGSTAGTLHVAGNTQWAGPLGPMLRIVLAQDLAARLQGATVLMPGDPLPPGGVNTIHVTIQTFMPDSTGTVSLQADWVVLAPDGQTIRARGRFTQSVPGGTQPAAEAQSMSADLGRLADTIAAALAAA